MHRSCLTYRYLLHRDCASTLFVGSGSARRAAMSDEVSELRAALAASNALLEQERAYRIDQDLALAATLDDVRDRSVQLQAEMTANVHCSSRPVDLGHPQRLQDFAIGLDEGVGSQPPEPALGYNWVTTPAASTICSRRSLASPAASGHARDSWQPSRQSPAWDGRSPATHARKRGSEVEELDLGREKRMLVSRAEAACDVLARLVERTGPHHNALPDGRRLAGTERNLHWIESCEAQLLSWIDKRHEQTAHADLRELRLHAEVREVRSTASAACERERDRSARAESRCQKLVAELRTTVRAVVDGHQTGLGENEPLELLLNKNTVREIATNRDRQSRLSARWEQQRLRERTASQLELKAGERSRQAMRQQLALPGMPASLVADR